MRSEWRDVILGDIVEVKQGLAINAKSKHLLVDDGMPLLRITDLLNDNQVQFINAKEAPKQCLANADDLIYTRTGQVGYVFRGKVGVVHNNCFRVIPKTDSTTRGFLYWFLSQNKIRQYANDIASGSVQKDLKHSAFYSIPLSIPSKVTQLRIEKILNSIEDKIELNRKMNQTLEEMAQALFKSWFVDFDPVHAKAKCSSDGELEIAAKELGISKEILNLFPSEFEESELGMIPKAWEVKKFGDLLNNTIGGDWGKEEPDTKHTEKVKIIRGTDIPKIKSIDIESVPTRYVEAKKLKTREVFDGDIIIEISGGTKNQPTGRSLYVTNDVVHMLDGKVEPASFCRLFRPINKEVGLLLGQHLLFIYDAGKTWNYQNQSTGISNFQTTTFLEKEYVVVPNNEVVEKFYEIVRPLIERSLFSENITLQQTRDTLLPKLLSGELDVSELEFDMRGN